ncbi:hypothetical protein ISN76_20330 [Dyella halodurans]|uniref:Uncharacterized protein n=1 Tax=Dyella halodurans TaxID=1920171 RepID=A0ABV9BWI2_9GAMM|nr:hypothetical protein [Dyella halodurans]
MTLKAHLEIQAAVVPQPAVRAVLDRSGKRSVIYKSLQIHQADAANAGVRKIVVDH